MIGAIPLFRLHVLMAWKGKFYIFYITSLNRLMVYTSVRPSTFYSSETGGLLLLGAELPLVESFGLLNYLFPFPSILDADYPVLDLQLADVLFDVILPSFLVIF
jgi:hypothetical protein